MFAPHKANNMPRASKNNPTGLSPDELAELQQLRAFKEAKQKEENQALGLRPEYEDYKVPKGEENHAHLLVGFIAEPNRFDRAKDKLGRTLVHKLRPRAYANFLDNMVAMGYKIVKVLHLPEKGFLAPMEYFKQKEEAKAKKVAAAKRVAANQEAALVVK